VTRGSGAIIGQEKNPGEPSPPFDYDGIDLMNGCNNLAGRAKNFPPDLLDLAGKKASRGVA